ncbi:unnamed protein product [Withania somnifera]
MVSISSNNQKQQLLSKIATNDGHGENSSYFDGWKAYANDPFHLTDNPDGVIQMGLAENQLCFDLIQEWVVNNPKASICTAEGAEDFKDIAIFQDYHGLPEFRQAVARFMEKVRGDRVTFDPHRIVMSGGATGAHEMLAFCLADPGDAFLVPTPYYPGFDRDLRWRTGVQLFPVVCQSCNDFKVTRTALEDAYEKAQESNIKIKGLLINNPSNPLGTLLDKDTLRDIITFINSKNIHLVCDEIYAATVFDHPKFISVSEIVEEMIGCNQDLIHIVYSLSKDMGFPGFRVGIVYSYNDTDSEHCKKNVELRASFHSDTTSACINFLAESSERLGIRKEMFTKGLAQVGISTLKSNAGLFFWMDLRRLLKEPTFEAELELWRIIIHEVKLNVSPGCSFHCSEPGWFRVCFANMDDETMRTALRRIRNFVLQTKGLNSKIVALKKQCSRTKLQISLSFRRLDDFMNSPAHSPMNSPLVRT